MAAVTVVAADVAADGGALGVGVAVALAVAVVARAGVGRVMCHLAKR